MGGRGGEKGERFPDLGRVQAGRSIQIVLTVKIYVKKALIRLWVLIPHYVDLLHLPLLLGYPDVPFSLPYSQVLPCWPQPMLSAFLQLDRAVPVARAFRW